MLLDITRYGEVFYQFYTCTLLQRLYTEPYIHLFCMSIGATVGYGAHIFEEGSHERYKKLVEKYPEHPLTRMAPQEQVEKK